MEDIDVVGAAVAQLYQESSLAVVLLQNVLLEEEVVASTSSMKMIPEKKIHYCRCCLVANSCLQLMSVFDLQTHQPHDIITTMTIHHSIISGIVCATFYWPSFLRG